VTSTQALIPWAELGENFIGFSTCFFVEIFIIGARVQEERGFRGGHVFLKVHSGVRLFMGKVLGVKENAMRTSKS
jgi:hypothetical protein